MLIRPSEHSNFHCFCWRCLSPAIGGTAWHCPYERQGHLKGKWGPQIHQLTVRLLFSWLALWSTVQALLFPSVFMWQCKQSLQIHCTFGRTLKHAVVREASCLTNALLATAWLHCICSVFAACEVLLCECLLPHLLNVAFQASLLVLQTPSKSLNPVSFWRMVCQVLACGSLSRWGRKKSRSEGPFSTSTAVSHDYDWVVAAADTFVTNSCSCGFWCCSLLLLCLWPMLCLWPVLFMWSMLYYNNSCAHHT